MRLIRWYRRRRLGCGPAPDYRLLCHLSKGDFEKTSVAKMQAWVAAVNDGRVAAHLKVYECPDDPGYVVLTINVI